MSLRCRRIFWVTAPCVTTFGASTSRVPTFQEFPAPAPSNRPSASVDLSSHPNAKSYRTRLREGAAKGPNFAGHYSLVWWGCGNECQQVLIVDLNTGRVYGISGEPQLLQSSRGVDFKLTSSMLIVDPPCPEDYNPCVSLGRSDRPVRYYVMEDHGLRLIHQTPCRFASEKLECK